MKSEEKIREVLELFRNGCTTTETCSGCPAENICGKNKTGVLKWVLDE